MELLEPCLTGQIAAERRAWRFISTLAHSSAVKFTRSGTIARVWSWNDLSQPTTTQTGCSTCFRITKIVPQRWGHHQSIAEPFLADPCEEFGVLFDSATVGSLEAVTEKGKPKGHHFVTLCEVVIVRTDDSWAENPRAHQPSGSVCSCGTSYWTPFCGIARFRSCISSSVVHRAWESRLLPVTTSAQPAQLDIDTLSPDESLYSASAAATSGAAATLPAMGLGPPLSDVRRRSATPNITFRALAKRVVFFNQKQNHAQDDGLMTQGVPVRWPGANHDDMTRWMVK
jgi:hypothetical protein